MDKKKAEKIIKELKKLFPNPEIALNYSSPIELLVAVILSAQTTDKQVNVVTKELFKKYKTIEDYMNTPLPEFENDIKKIGLYKSKAKNIKGSLETIYNEYESKIPDTMERLIKLPGIGRKTANVLLYVLYSKSEGIAVDTHVKRFSRLFGLSLSSNPDKIEKDLMQIIPNENWGEITYLLIDYGRKYCPARCAHEKCPLRNLII